MERYYQTAQKLKRNNVKIKHETVEDFLKRGGVIKMCEVNRNSQAEFEAKQTAKGLKRRQKGKAGGIRYTNESMDVIDDVLG